MKKTNLLALALLVSTGLAYGLVGDVIEGAGRAVADVTHAAGDVVEETTEAVAQPFRRYPDRVYVERPVYGTTVRTGEVVEPGYESYQPGYQEPVVRPIR